MKTKTKTISLHPIVLLVFALMLSMPTRGQDAEEQMVSVGAKVLSNMTVSNGTTSAFGYGAGGYVNLNLLSFLTVRGELLYVSHAARLNSYNESLGSGGSVDYHHRNLRFHTLEIPILLQFPLPIMESLKPKIYVGGSYSYNFSVYEINNRAYKLTNPESTINYYGYGDNVSSYFQMYNASAIGGLSVSFDSFVVDARYQQGFPNLVKGNDLKILPYPMDYKSRIITLSLGYKIF